MKECNSNLNVHSKLEWAKSFNNKDYGYEKYLNIATNEFVERFILKPGDAVGKDIETYRERSEIRASIGHFKSFIGADFEVFFPDSFKNYKGKTVFFQIFNVPGEYPLAHISIRNTNYHLETSDYKDNTKNVCLTDSVVYNQWNKISITVDWANNENGHIFIKINNQMLEYRGKNCSDTEDNTEEEGIIKYGLYRPFFNKYYPTGGHQTQMIIFKNFNIYLK